MSLGGYKFAGRYCEKGSLTLSEWCLRIHKTRVAAFLAANTLAGSPWAVYMDGSPDGQYHALTSGTTSYPFNFVTCFYCASKGTYFAIYTMPAVNSDTAANQSYIVATLPNAYWNGSSRKYIGCYNSCFYSIGTSPITYDRAYSTFGTTQSGVSPVLPVGNIGWNSSSQLNPAGSSSYALSGTSARFGFAIKGDSIVMIQGAGNNEGSSSSLCVSVASGHAFSSFVNDGDTYGAMCHNIQSFASGSSTSSNYETGSRYTAQGNYSSMSIPVFMVQKVDGFFTYPCEYLCVPLSAYNASINSYPFQALSVYGVANTVTGVKGKGTISVDLLAVNFPGFGQGLYPANFSTMANGNYLTVHHAGSATTSSQYGIEIKGLNSDMTASVYDIALYVGWDPSNPDITQASAWSLYDET